MYYLIYTVNSMTAEKITTRRERIGQHWLDSHEKRTEWSGLGTGRDSERVLKAKADVHIIKLSMQLVTFADNNEIWYDIVCPLGRLNAAIHKLALAKYEIDEEKRIFPLSPFQFGYFDVKVVSTIRHNRTILGLVWMWMFCVWQTFRKLSMEMECDYFSFSIRQWHCVCVWVAVRHL